MSFCNVCTDAPDFPPPILGTNTGLSLKSGGYNFLMLARCDVDTSTLGTTLSNWNTALQDQDAYRAFFQCTVSGSQVETPAADPQKIGSCGVFVKPNTQRDGVVTFVFREDNDSADIYKYFKGVDGQQVQFAIGSCDNKSLYVFRKGTLYFGESNSPESKDEFRTYTVTINYIAQGDSYDLVGQTWAISDLVIP